VSATTPIFIGLDLPDQLAQGQEAVPQAPTSGQAGPQGSAGEETLAENELNNFSILALPHSGQAASSGSRLTPTSTSNRDEHFWQ